MFQRDPLPLRTLLEELIRNSPLEEKLQYAALPAVWREVVGSPLDRYAVPVKVEDGCLIVHVESAVWRTELELRKEQLLKRINERLAPRKLREMKVLFRPFGAR